MLTGESRRLGHDPVEGHPARIQQCFYLAMQISDPKIMRDWLRLTVKVDDVLRQATLPYLKTMNTF